MSLSFAKIVALLILAFTSCLTSVEAKDASHKIRRRAAEGEVVEIDVVEGDKKDKNSKNNKNKKEEAPKCISVIGQACNPAVADMACCLDSSQGQFLQCDDKNFVCELMKDKDIEKFRAAEAAANAGAGTAQASGQKNSKQKEPACVEAIGGWCDNVSARCCLNPSKNQFLQCDTKNFECELMKDKDIESMLGATYTATDGGCQSDKDCCDEDKECNELTGECFKPSCPKECFSDDQCKPCNKDCIAGKCSANCPNYCSNDKDCKDCDKVCLNNKCDKPKCEWCNDDKDCKDCGEVCNVFKQECEKPSCDYCTDDKDCKACDKVCNMSERKCEKPSCPDTCWDDDQCKPCGEVCVAGKCERDCVA